MARVNVSMYSYIGDVSVEVEVEERSGPGEKEAIRDALASAVAKVMRAYSIDLDDE